MEPKKTTEVNPEERAAQIPSVASCYLLPCPFCGGEADNRPQYGVVECMDCGVEKEGDDLHDAVFFWNQRDCWENSRNPPEPGVYLGVVESFYQPLVEVVIWDGFEWLDSDGRTCRINNWCFLPEIPDHLF